MTIWDRIDTAWIPALDWALLWGAAKVMLVLGVWCAMVMAGQWAWRWVGRRRRARSLLRKRYGAQLEWERQHGKRR